ncbi:MAG: hypothetical protein ACTHM1_12045 [Solirubrobacteraceae bacterium]
MTIKTGPLHAYLKELRAGKLPVDAKRIEQFGLPGVVLDETSETANAEMFLALLKECLNRLGVSDKILVQHYLFTKGTATDCARAAHRDLEEHDQFISDNYYKNHLRAALEAYAQVLGAELPTSKPVGHHRQPSPSITPDWFEALEIEWLLRLDEKDYRRQYWRRRLLLRCRTGDQPIVALPQHWSGKGKRDNRVNRVGKVEMLSGPRDKKDPWSHQCLRTRPEKHDFWSWELYIFDLGKPMLPGETETLEYAEILMDDKDQFRPQLMQHTARHPALEKLILKVEIPADLGVTSMIAYREIRTPEVGTGYSPVEPILKISPNDDGIFCHEVKGKDIDHLSRHVLSWDAGYRQR